MRRKLVIILLSVLTATMAAGCGNQDTNTKENEVVASTEVQSIQETTIAEEVKQLEPATQTNKVVESSEAAEETIEVTTEAPVAVEDTEEKIEYIILDFIDIEKNEEEINKRIVIETNVSNKETLTSQIYTSWDNELNKLWKSLKETLNEEEMAPLLQEQREWLALKENSLKLYADPIEINNEAMKLTKKRCYELGAILADKKEQLFVTPVVDCPIDDQDIKDFLSGKTKVVLRQDKNGNNEEVSYLELSALNCGYGYDYIDNEIINLGKIERYGDTFWVLYIQTDYLMIGDSTYVITKKPDGLYVTEGGDDVYRCYYSINSSGLIWSGGSAGAGHHIDKLYCLDKDGEAQMIYGDHKAYTGWIRGVIGYDLDWPFSPDTIDIAKELDYSDNLDDFGVDLIRTKDKVYGIDKSENEHPEIALKFIEATKKDGMIWITEDEWNKISEDLLNEYGFTTDDYNAGAPEWIRLN